MTSTWPDRQSDRHTDRPPEIPPSHLDTWPPTPARHLSNEIDFSAELTADWIDSRFYTDGNLRKGRPMVPGETWRRGRGGGGIREWGRSYRIGGYNHSHPPRFPPYHHLFSPTFTKTTSTLCLRLHLAPPTHTPFPSLRAGYT